jgi:hypothetical protein
MGSVARPASQTVVGSFTDPGDFGRLGAGVEVARFTY